MLLPVLLFKCLYYSPVMLYHNYLFTCQASLADWQLFEGRDYVFVITIASEFVKKLSRNAY